MGARAYIDFMPEFCDVALPVPLDIVFTYAVPDGMQPVVGGRVLVPFRQQRMSGIVTALHDRKPTVKTKNVISVLDSAPVLDEQLIRWANGLPTTILRPSAKSSAPCCRWARNSSGPSAIASPNTGTWRCTWPGCRDRPRARRKLPKTS